MINTLLIDLAHEAVHQHKADTSRVLRAMTIIDEKKITLAHKDENGHPIAPSLDLFAEAGREGWYTVSRGRCTCPDSSLSGNACKHRIAAWMYKELEIRTAAEVMHITPAEYIARQDARASQPVDFD